MNTFRFWADNEFNFIFSTNANREKVVEVINYVQENIEDYDNESVCERLEELGFMIVRHEDEIPKENEFYWG